MDYFEELVERAIEKIPRRFRRRLKNVAFVIEHEPSPAHRARAGLRSGSILLGLYEGRPLPSRSVFESFAWPDRITVFQGPHERMAVNREHLARLVEDTIWHEVAHYFGMDERRVRVAERRRKSQR
jgi:predicted Zn-dependent protease with MMP-like domain